MPLWLAAVVYACGAAGAALGLVGFAAARRAKAGERDAAAEALYWRGRALARAEEPVAAGADPADRSEHWVG